MAKLYPPHIEGALPAFCGNTLIIPFEHSRAVAPAEIDGYHYILKDIQQSGIISSEIAPKEGASQDAAGNWGLSLANINTSQLSPGSFYKLQLAYRKNGQTGYFSDVGIIKYIQKPEVKIVNSNNIELSQVGTNNHKYHYELVYTCKDNTEKLYSAQFVLLKGNKDNVIASSDVLIHNTTNDSIYSGNEGYDFLQELDPKENYWIMALVTTVSGYTLTTPYYPLSAQVGIPNLTGTHLNPILDFDNGCISLYIWGEGKTSYSGKYKLVRADEKENFSIWHSLIEIEFSQTNITKDNQYLFWRDFTIEQGYNYIYGLIQVNDSGNYSSRIQSDSIHADFEDAFLFDGDKQLRIRFDPKVSSFKVTVQEAKTDTIGGQYPIIQRNGYTNYKEFPIAGLISHLSDPAGYFNKGIAALKEIDNNSIVTDITDEWDGLNYQTNLNSKNVQLERRFKLEVLNWLNNGKPKLFRSPTEGNYLVRLLNVSLSPIDTLGRMLHSFSCTAYEIDDTSPEKLVKHGIIKDYFLEGRHNYNFDRNVISYYLSNLGDGNFLETQSELRGKEILGAAFAIQPNLQDVYVNINNKNVKVSDPANATYNAPITHLSRPTGGQAMHNSTPDLMTLSYRNVLSSDVFNNYINDIVSDNEVNQYNGFNYSDMFGDIKLFLQKIYKMICNVRPIVEKAIELTTDVVLDMMSWGIDALKEFIKEHFHCCLGSMIYKILDTAGNIIGYIDGEKGTWIKIGSEIFTSLASATVSFIRGSGIANSIYTITKETIFKDTDFDSAITNIIANPFTCVDIIYKTGVNVFNTLTNSNGVSLSTVSSLNTLLGESGNVAASGITGALVNTCENLYNQITKTLSSSGTLPVNSSTINTTPTNDGNAQTILGQVATVGTGLCNAAIGVLGAVVDNTKSTPITQISSSIMNLFSGSFNGLFGGMC